MREIKFRAWDKRHKSMEQMQDLYWFEENDVRQAHEADSMTGDWVIMQYTGLKDKNGKEIYEGDIVRAYIFADSNLYRDYIVERGKFGEYRLRHETRRFDALLADTEGHAIEVIGNIYENPELLEGKEPTHE